MNRARVSGTDAAQRPGRDLNQVPGWYSKLKREAAQVTEVRLAFGNDGYVPYGTDVASNSYYHKKWAATKAARGKPGRLETQYDAGRDASIAASADAGNAVVNPVGLH